MIPDAWYKKHEDMPPNLPNHDDDKYINNNNSDDDDDYLPFLLSMFL